MAGEVVETKGREVQVDSVQETLQNKRVISQVMTSVMKAETHYGVIPGCKQPSLYKAGSEALLSTFHISAEPVVEELISRDSKGRVSEIRYRVKCIGRHTPSDRIIGYGIGECSTGEDKYAWRRATCTEEFESTDESLRRLKWTSYQNKSKKTEQVRVSPSDMSNTVLKMAKKRAQIDMTLTTLGCSDIFAQDLEDIDEALRENIAGKTATVSDPLLREKWVAAANSAKDEDEVKKVWADGLAEIRPTNDMEAYSALKAAIAARGKALKAKQAPAQQSADDFDAGLDSYTPE